MVKMDIPDALPKVCRVVVVVVVVVAIVMVVVVMVVVVVVVAVLGWYGVRRSLSLLYNTA